MHLDAEQVERLLHGELAATSERPVRQHLAQCDACRERIAAADQDSSEIHALLRQVDHEPPRIDATRVMVRGSARRPGWSRWAAGILLLLGTTGVLYAAPGSPLPRWLAAVAEWIGHRVEPAPGPAPTAPAATPAIAGIAVDPGQSLVISFTTAQLDGQVQVSMTDSAEVVVRAPSGAATFTTHAARLVIDNHGPAAKFEIQIPRSAPRVEILVNGSRILLKEGHRVTTDDTTAQTSPYVLPLKPGGTQP